MPSTLYLTYSAWRAATDLDHDVIQAARAGDEMARASVVEETDKRLGERVAATLRHRGLDVTWNGSRKSRLGVSITDWRKPLPS